MSDQAMKQMYWACAELLTLGAQLSTATALPAADVLRHRLGALFEAMARRAREADFSEADIRDVRYALAAFLDEQLLRLHWPGQQQWQSQPLQLTLFGENTAGEGFFRKASELQQDPRRAPVLQIYYFCVALGFRGQYAVRGGEGLQAAVDYNASLLGRQLPATEPISPRGEPPETVRAAARRGLPWTRMSLGLAASALVIFFALKGVLRLEMSSASRDMRAASTGDTSPAGAAAPRP